MNSTIYITQTAANEWEVMTAKLTFLITQGVVGCTVVEFDEYTPVDEFYAPDFDTALEMIEHA